MFPVALRGFQMVSRKSLRGSAQVRSKVPGGPSVSNRVWGAGSPALEILLAEGNFEVGGGGGGGGGVSDTGWVVACMSKDPSSQGSYVVALSIKVISSYSSS